MEKKRSLVPALMSAILTLFVCFFVFSFLTARLIDLHGQAISLGVSSDIIFPLASHMRAIEQMMKEEKYEAACREITLLREALGDRGGDTGRFVDSLYRLTRGLELRMSEGGRGAEATPVLAAVAGEAGSVISVPLPGREPKELNPFSLVVADSRAREGESARLTITVKNMGSQPLRLTQSHGIIEDYRVALFAGDGAVLLGSQGLTTREEIERLPRSLTGSHFTAVLQPGESTLRTIVFPDTRQLPPGNYHLLVTRKRGLTWESGYVISNLAKLRVLDKPQKPE